MKECYIDFPHEVCRGLIGTKEEVKTFLKKQGDFDYEGIQRTRNSALHKWEKVLVFSYMSYEGTGFICYKTEKNA